jgi:hypothetical protein
MKNEKSEIRKTTYKKTKDIYGEIVPGAAYKI